MFTGIIETIGLVEEVVAAGTNKTFWISSPLSQELKVDQSIAHNGVCLTVEAVQANRHQVTAIAETLQKSNIGHWKTGDLVNLERCMPMNGRLDGHIVQGHVDTTGTCINRKELNGSWEFRFRFPATFTNLVIEKGSISMNGTSLTIFNVTKDEFSVAIIPYTFEHTNIKNIHPGTTVNLEFDMVGKYVARITQSRTGL
ncbi:riboflavin synthase [Niastella caeni]|uniref:Riboflavin synthase n=1 Tax=Niastella caeni TaxID=2569763 RepID=A0A4S8HD36_9BACT|nr:riboflavin synthase [Niastella caeni]THU32940.1 riboflavin synthase [Niastella caeni]